MRILLVRRWALADQQIEVIVNADQSADGAPSAAGDDVAFVEHPLRSGGCDVAEQGITGAVDG